MALNVGELCAVITADASGVDEGLREAMRAMQRGGQRMAQDAERSGREAGQQLGDGIERGAERGFRGLSSQATAAGHSAGQGLGHGLGESGGAGADTAVGGMTEKLGKLKMAAGGIGLAAGTFLMDSFNQAMDQGKITARLGAQLGATGPEAKRYGHIAGQLYADAVTEDFQGAANAIKAVASEGLIPPKATNDQIQSIAMNASDLADMLEVDVGEAAQAAGTMVKNGLAKNGKEAFDILVKGSRGLGRASEDVLETFSEYSPIFKSAGLSGRTAMGLIRQAVKGGWGKDTDKIADAFKELGIRATDMSTASVAALQDLGLNAQQTADDVAAGGSRGEKAMGLILEKIKKLGPDSAKAKQIISALFGGPGEDLGAALFKLNVDKASKSMANAKGAANDYGDALRDNAATKVTQFKRGIQQGVIDFLGGQVIPAVTKFKGFIVQHLGGMWAEAGANGATGIDKFFAFLPLLGQKLVTKVKELAPKAVEGLQQLGTDIANWMMENPDKMFKIALFAQAIIVGMSLLPMLVIAAVVAAAGMIMMSFGRRLVSSAWEHLTGFGSVMGMFFGNLWSTYVATPVSTFLTNFTTWIGRLPGRASRALSALGTNISGVASRAWQDFKDASVRKTVEFITWVQGLPGRIRRGIGDLKSLLVSKGADVVRGLLAGVQSMGGWLRSQLMSFAKSMIPGPIAKALGIHSPSKVMASQVGRWIPAGIAQGAEDNVGVLDRTMSNLVNTPTPAAAMATGMSAAAAGASGGSSSRTITHRVELGGEMGDAITNVLRQKIATNGRGNVQLYLGKG
ncbi:phage tail tape measure protein [Streptomyces sp. NPDC102383]|uniref:phage tail tape measure protein n=1 Tax=Streptomyces sp. NPDC102383 TaxID=3366165 RepID=UPI0037F76E98